MGDTEREREQKRNGERERERAFFKQLKTFKRILNHKKELEIKKGRKKEGKGEKAMNI